MKLTDFEPDYVERMRQRFWQKVNKGAPNECWEWTGAKQPRGYGNFSFCDNTGKQHMVGAHRVVVLLRNGELLPSTTVCHICDNPQCVNPGHLIAGTRSDNVRDMLSKGRESRLCGEKAPQARLSRGEVFHIRALLEMGNTQLSIANQFGVAESTIWCIANEKTWSHI